MFRHKRTRRPVKAGASLRKVLRSKVPVPQNPSQTVPSMPRFHLLLAFQHIMTSPRHVFTGETFGTRHSTVKSTDTAARAHSPCSQLKMVSCQSRCCPKVTTVLRLPDDGLNSVWQTSLQALMLSLHFGIRSGYIPTHDFFFNNFFFNNFFSKFFLSIQLFFLWQ